MSNQEILLTSNQLKKALTGLTVKPPASQLVKTKGAKAVKILIIKTAAQESPQAEIHNNFNDLFIVQSGGEEFWVGGKIKDKVQTKPGEWLGKNLVGAKKLHLKSGDILIVPKGVPHRHGKGKGVFLVIKTG